MTTTIPLLPGAVITTGPQAWQVLQREADGHAPVTLAGTCAGEMPGVVEVRVASEYDSASVPACNWRDAEMLDGQAWRITLRVPTGGLYRLETRMRLAGMVGGYYPGDKIWHVAVGDVWVIAGQSNAVAMAMARSWTRRRWACRSLAATRSGGWPRIPSWTLPAPISGQPRLRVGGCVAVA